MGDPTFLVATSCVPNMSRKLYYKAKTENPLYYALLDYTVRLMKLEMTPD